MADAIQRAFEAITVYGEGDSVSAYDGGVGKFWANSMLKSWQNQAEHLWVRQKVILFLQALQPTYTISLTSADNFTADIPVSAQLTVANIVGDTIINVADSSIFTNGAHIGIQTNSNNFFWTTIASKPTATTIQISAPLTSAASIGLYVFSYINKVTNIFNVSTLGATRRLIASQIDIPILWQSYVDYNNMPNKLTAGTPNMWSYDRQRDSFIFNIWQNPKDVSYYLNFLVDRKIQDVNVNSDEFDLPQEWSDAFVLNLAVRLAVVYGKAQGENFQELKAQAADSLMKAMENDNELGSLYIIPSRGGVRGR